MNGKFIGIVIGAVVAIMLVGSFLVPIIDEFTDPGTETITVERDGAIWEKMAYIGWDFNTDALDIKISATTDNTIKVDFNGDIVANYPIGNTFANNEIAIYSDTYIGYVTVDNGVFTDNVYLEFDTQLPTINNSLSENKLILEIKIIPGETITYSTGYAGSSDWLIVDIPTEASWMSSFDVAYPCDTGDYSNFPGDWLSDAVVMYSGGCIAPLYKTETITNDPAPYAYILVVIPIVILASLLVAVAALAFKKEY